MKTIFELEKMAQEDLETRNEDLEYISIVSAKQKSKYFRIQNEIVLFIKKKESELKKLKVKKYQYFKHDYEYVLSTKGEIDMHIAADDEVIELTNKIEMAKQADDYIDKIINTLSQRSFEVKNVLEYRKFTEGG